MNLLYRLIMRKKAIKVTEKQIRSGKYSHRNRYMIWNRPTVWLCGVLVSIFILFTFIAK